MQASRRPEPVVCMRRAALSLWCAGVALPRFATRAWFLAVFLPWRLSAVQSESPPPSTPHAPPAAPPSQAAPPPPPKLQQQKARERQPAALAAKAAADPKLPASSSSGGSAAWDSALAGPVPPASSSGAGVAAAGDFPLSGRLGTIPLDYRAVFLSKAAPKLPHSSASAWDSALALAAIQLIFTSFLYEVMIQSIVSAFLKPLAVFR